MEVKVIVPVARVSGLMAEVEDAAGMDVRVGVLEGV